MADIHAENFEPSHTLTVYTTLHGTREKKIVEEFLILWRISKINEDDRNKLVHTVFEFKDANLLGAFFISNSLLEF